MPAITSEASSMLTNPLDLMEQVIGGHGWTFERCTPTEMAAEAPSRWCDYGLFFHGLPNWAPFCLPALLT